MSDKKDIIKISISILVSSLILISTLFLAGCFFDNELETNQTNVDLNTENSNSNSNTENKTSSDNESDSGLISTIKSSGKTKSSLPPPPKPQ